MKKVIISFIILLSTTTAIGTESKNWQQVDESNFIYTEGIARTSSLYGFSFLLKAYNKGQYEPIDGKEILYTLGNYTINCEKMEYKIGTIDSYDRHNNFINGDYNKYAKFQSIAEGTAVSEVARTLCRP